MTSPTPTPPPTPAPPDEPGWPGTPRLSDLLADTMANARAQLAATLTLILITATACFAILVTTGQSAASEARIMEQIDAAGTRLIALSDSDGAAGILPTAPHQLARISDVTWALGLGTAVDVTNPALPAGHSASRLMVGDLPADLTLLQGRPPRPGEAVAGATAAGTLNLGAGLGRITTSDPEATPVGVVGVFRASGPLAHLNDTILIAAHPDELDTLRYVYVMASDVTAVDRLETVLADSTPALNPAALTIETPTGAIALRDAIAGRLGTASRQLMAVVMAVSAVVIAVTTLATTLARRREFGRRRALGATRSALVGTLLLHTGLCAAAGTALGSVAGLATLTATTGSLPTWQFTTAVAGLTLLLSLAASAPTATIAAHRDPLRILRVP